MKHRRYRERCHSPSTAECNKTHWQKRMKSKRVHIGTHTHTRFPLTLICKRISRTNTTRQTYLFQIKTNGKRIYLSLSFSLSLSLSQLRVSAPPSSMSRCALQRFTDQKNNTNSPLVYVSMCTTTFYGTKKQHQNCIPFGLPEFFTLARWNRTHQLRSDI